LNEGEYVFLKGVMLHGRHGTRLRPLTHTRPKQLILIANKPMSQYVLEDLEDSGIHDISIILGNILPEKVKQYCARTLREILALLRRKPQIIEINKHLEETYFKRIQGQSKIKLKKLWKTTAGRKISKI